MFSVLEKSKPDKTMKIITSSVIAFTLILPTYSFAKTTMDYVTSVQVNGIELSKPVSANQVDKIFGKTIQKISKEYSECTANHEYSTAFNHHKQLKFEIFAEDNPQIKSDAYYKTKNNFQQLSTTKGRVWLSWSNATHLTEQLKLNQKTIDAKYTLAQFKKDFPISANNKNNIVLMLNASEAKHYLKNPTDFDAAYTSALYFKFQNGKLASLEINQGIAC